MKIKVGTLKQIIVSLVLIGTVVMATMSPHIANVHLALTLFLGMLHIYLGIQLGENKVKPKDDMPASYAYIIAFVINVIMSCAFSWWFSAIVWAYIIIIYIAANQPQKKKGRDNDPVIKSNEGEVK